MWKTCIFLPKRPVYVENRPIKETYTCENTHHILLHIYTTHMENTPRRQTYQTYMKMYVTEVDLYM